MFVGASLNLLVLGFGFGCGFSGSPMNVRKYYRLHERHKPAKHLDVSRCIIRVLYNRIGFISLHWDGVREDFHGVFEITIRLLLQPDAVWSKYTLFFHVSSMLIIVSSLVLYQYNLEVRTRIRGFQCDVTLN